MNPVRTAWRVFRRQGARVVVQKTMTRMFAHGPTYHSLVQYDDAISVDWSTPHPSVTSPRALGAGPFIFAWIMSPPGANSGGHQNLFRFIKFLEDAGHVVRIYLYSSTAPDTVAQVRERVRESTSYPTVRATIEEYPKGGVPADVDALFATGWETAYPSFRDKSDARRFYFVQDFEPLFYATGTESLLAENTYRFGFTGITAGGWLAQKLRTQYGMRAQSFDFGADVSNYSVLNTGNRRAVFFYARPETPRRGFEIGAMALDLVTRDRPGTPIILAGQDLRGLPIPFPYENPGNVQVGDLNELYNRCAVGLVLSLTNLSLLPLELLSAGVIPVVNDGDNNRLVSSNPYIEYTEPSPRALADRIIAVLDRDDLAAHSAAAAASVAESNWLKSASQFLAAVESGMHG